MTSFRFPGADHDASSSVSSHMDALHTSNQEDRLIAKEGKSWYVGDEASVVLGDKVCYFDFVC